MNKRLIIYTVGLFIIFFTFGQSLDSFNEERLAINEKGMLVLGTWALLNIASSPILASKTIGPTKYFHQMNGYWNGVNLVIAGYGYYTAITGDASISVVESIKEQQSIENILLFNTGLDLAYVAAGLYLNERGKNKANDRLKGFGKSMMLQGGFLLTFDIALYLVHQSHSSELFKYINQVSISPVGFALIWKI